MQKNEVFSESSVKTVVQSKQKNTWICVGMEVELISIKKGLVNVKGISVELSQVS